MAVRHEMLTVFTEGEAGGNRVPVVLEADTFTDQQMQELAEETGLESAFLSPSDTPAVGRLRYWVPNHEMSMCGHATIGTAWLLNRRGHAQPDDGYVFATAAGLVRAGATTDGGWFQQSLQQIDPVDPGPALAALGLTPDDLVGTSSNAAAPRTKTLLPLRNTAVLRGLRPHAAAVERACTEMGSTGLYPYAVITEGQVEARQFPRASGYLEDPATGIAAAALFFALAASGELPRGVLQVRQGAAMGRPSLITVEAGGQSHHQTRTCRVSGAVRFA
ncbi:PhzF family phenazine biosynthesis protein [Curtobacterium sp. MCBD17_008]|uniref:PhzF family phenazine biosynthesis protein n=1 Tax=Curtobacterium sp. MCBD17_008 TaxID=2175656 RepID=UPI000DA9FC80|nr:PhzF family phenazine biosynthesis protein [Curtobacterium sp. MCBD17_008]PZE95225.1 phenazine biosynthesis protein PhzF [Curtobacterium sp. MCBD17_008]